MISHATQERLSGLLEKLTVIAQHRVMTYKVKEIIIELRGVNSKAVSSGSQKLVIVTLKYTLP